MSSAPTTASRRWISSLGCRRLPKRPCRNGGTKIQHAIYARVVEKMVGGRVTRSGYLFPTSRGGGARLERKCTDKELSDALNALFDVVSRGFFPHGSEDTCKFCEFQSVCCGAKIAAERMEMKFAKNENDAAVQAWLKLQAV